MLKDVSRVVSSSAYLLFYRRRSEVPLGGPRFQEIFNKFENPNDISEDEESGEDQGLVGDSSQLGSSRALTGVGVAHRANGSQHGAKTTTTNPKDHDELPDYDGDMMPTLTMNDNLHPSVEEDEGIDVGGDYDSLNTQNINRISQGTGITSNWDWEGLGLTSRAGVSGAGSDADNVSDRSDGVNAGSTASATSLANRYQEFEDAPAEDEPGMPYEDPSYVPDMDDDAEAGAIGLQHDLLDQMNHMHYPVSHQYEEERLEVEEPATEIHLDDNDDPKMD